MIRRPDPSHAHWTPRSSAPGRPARLLPPLGCVTYEVGEAAIEVIVTDVAGERQRRRELQLYLETWRAQHPGVELELLDQSG
jgi:hypothetical protein